MFRKYERVLRAIYSRYRTSMKGGGVRLKMIGMDGWEAFAEDVGLVADDMPIQELRLCFLYSRMNCKDEVRDWIKFTTLTFIDFLEVWPCGMEDVVPLRAFMLVKEDALMIVASVELFVALGVKSEWFSELVLATSMKIGLQSDIPRNCTWFDAYRGGYEHSKSLRCVFF